MTVVFFVAITAQLMVGGRALRFLHDVAPLSAAGAPPVSIVVAARNEERNLEAALRSLLAQHYPRLEIVVVDDRSVDATGAILDRMAEGDPRLRVVHLTELPPGWLGKNHALQRGAEAASGEWILFTDADIVMNPTTVARAVALAMSERLDHLTVAPRVHMPGPVLQGFGTLFGIVFSLWTRPWKVSDPRSPSHVGIGAFNLLRATAYRAMGGHRPIRMRPDDDIKLGKLVKKNGFRQQFAVGTELISVEWYASVRELVHGLTKNAFAATEYRLGAVLAATAVNLLFFVWPFVAVFVTEGPARLLYGIAVGILLFIFVGAARMQGANPAPGLLFPLLNLLLLYIVWRSTLVTLATGGIEWRGTRYPLDELRANRV